LKNCIIGPHVSIGEGSEICRCIITNSIIQSESKISNANLDNSILGNFVDYKEKHKELNIGDFTVISQ
jgi:glucose-1-phosphate thymidylyltransferase